MGILGTFGWWLIGWKHLLKKNIYFCKRQLSYLVLSNKCWVLQTEKWRYQKKSVTLLPFLCFWLICLSFCWVRTQSDAIGVRKLLGYLELCVCITCDGLKDSCMLLVLITMICRYSFLLQGPNLGFFLFQGTHSTK